MKKVHLISILFLGVFGLAACGNNPGPKPVTLTHWYDVADWWNYCSNGTTGEQAVAEDIGKEVNLNVNGVDHKIRLIDIDHDDLVNGGKAHCTFEFVNLLSDSNGYSLATIWDTTNGSTSQNINYLDSALRKALDGSGNGTLRWYEKGFDVKSTTYTKPVIEMLPSDLYSNIKRVKKTVATTSTYNLTDYDAGVFALTHNEMTKNSNPNAKAEGTTYKYYADHDDDTSRIKYQIKWHDGAATGGEIINDLNWLPFNYAGYNNSTDNNYGGIYLLTSPYTNFSSDAWNVRYDGKLFDYDYVYNGAYAVAPAFCI